MLLEKESNQTGDVLSPLAEWRQLDGNNIEPEIQLFSESAALDGDLKVLVRGSNDSRFHLYPLVAAQGLDFTLLEGAQEFRLKLDRKLHDFIQKHSSFAGRCQQALPVVSRARKSSANVAEYFALNQGRRQRATVYWYERLVAPWAFRVNRARHQFFSRPAFPEDQDGIPRHSDFGDEVVNLLHSC
jgi:hypothetical protein